MNYEKEFRDTQRFRELTKNLPEDLDQQITRPDCSEEYKKICNEWVKSYVDYWSGPDGEARLGRYKNDVLGPILDEVGIDRDRVKTGKISVKDLKNLKNKNGGNN